jgi:hypothetical protein
LTDSVSKKLLCRRQPIHLNPWRRLARSSLPRLAATNNPDDAEHPWIERNPATGVQSLRILLPRPETARQIANALSALADSFHGRNA